jgi:uncharacterized RDD family membrane protein YckC
MSTPSAPGDLPGTEFEHASWARRIGALVLDWLGSTFVAVAIMGGKGYPQDNVYAWLPLVVFLVESAFGVALVGGSFGQVAVRIRVHHPDGRPLSLFGALLRQVLVCLVVPPLVFRADGRGLHDLWTRSGAYRVRSPTAI